MKIAILRTILPILIVTYLLTACAGTQPTAATEPALATATQELVTPTITATPDRCASGQIDAEVQKVHRHMREFDDASNLASHMPIEQLSGPIADLQRVRREAEDESIPPCLTNLKSYEIQHMNSVINTLIAFMSVSDPRSLDCIEVAKNSQEEAICQNINLARQQHDEYALELARLLGLTVVPAASIPTLTRTPTP